jgi:hypothetical protein
VISSSTTIIKLVSVATACLPSSAVCTNCPAFLCTFTMSPKTFSLGNFEDILRASEKEYGLSKGDEREKVLEALIGKITSDGQGKLKGTMKELKQVSLELY